MKNLLIISIILFAFSSCKKETDQETVIEGPVEKIHSIDIFPVDTSDIENKSVQQIEFHYRTDNKPDTIYLYSYIYSNEKDKFLNEKIVVEYLSPKRIKLTTAYSLSEPYLINQTIELMDGKVVKNATTQRNPFGLGFYKSLTEYSYTTDGKIKNIIGYTDPDNKKGLCNGLNNFKFDKNKIVSFNTYPLDTNLGDYYSDYEFSTSITYKKINGVNSNSIFNIFNNQILQFLYDNISFGYSTMTFLGNSSDEFITEISNKGKFLNGTIIDNKTFYEYIIDGKGRVVDYKGFYDDATTEPYLALYYKIKYVD
jgi:hypothetical protein